MNAKERKYPLRFPIRVHTRLFAAPRHIVSFVMILAIGIGRFSCL